MPEFGGDGVGAAGMTAAEKAMSFVTKDAEATLTNETQHKDLTGTDLHDPKSHGSLHENGGAQEISIAGLSGEAADDQPVKAHDIDPAVGKHTGGLPDSNIEGSGTVVTDLNADKLDGSHLAAIAQATKEFLIPCSYQSHVSNSYNPFIGGKMQGLNQAAYFNFQVPHDFSSLTSAYIVVYSDTTSATANIDIDSMYHAEGEAYNAHSESDTTTTYNIVANQSYHLDVSGILSAIAAGDHVALKLLAKEDVTNCQAFFGVFKYS